MSANDACRIQAAIFDFDGTISDSMYIWSECPCELIRRHGATPPDDILAIIGPMTMVDSLEWINDNFMGGECSISALQDELYAIIDDHYARIVQPKPGVLEAIRRLHAGGLRMCVLSATDSEFIRKALRRFGIEELFEFVACSDDWGGKTKPECFLQAAKRLGAEPAHIVVFEDAYHAASTAKAAGFYLAGVYDQSGDAHWQELKALADWHGDTMQGWQRI